MKRTILAALSFTLLLAGAGSLQVFSSESLRAIKSIRALNSGQWRQDPERLAIWLDACMARIPSGYFLMGASSGSTDQQPVRSVYLDAFEIDRFEVSNAQYQRFMRESGVPPPRYWEGGQYPQGLEMLPVVGVSWQQAGEYCEWAGKRLPTEAEWERACRGPQNLTYPWGSLWDPSLAHTNWHRPGLRPDDPDQTWPWLISGGPADTIPQPVGSFPRGCSAEGVFDLAGNVSEWVLDWYTADAYSTLPADNPVAQSPPWNHVVRGSAWLESGQEAFDAAVLSRCAVRNSSHSYDDPRIGFRCARSTSQ